jgi:GDP-L-fucose synthase
MMGIQLMESARLAGVKKFVSIGTVCEYPKLTPMPFKEENLWNGPVDETTGPYGLAKKMLLAQGEAYAKEYGFNAVHLLPINLYGPGDHFNLTTAHVLPMLIMKAIEAKEGKTPYLEVWGTGKASREFLYIDDAAEGVVLATGQYDKPDVVNLGIGRESTIKETVEMICKLVGYTGEIRWDSTKPDGQPRRMFDVSRAEREFGFKAKVQLEDGLKKTIEWYLAHRT